MPQPTGTINLNTGNILGSIRLNFPFEFIINSAAPGPITISGEDDDGQPYAWFNPNGATIPRGSTSVTVTATASTSQQEPWFTYSLTGMVGAGNVHVVVSSGDDIAKAG